MLLNSEICLAIAKGRLFELDVGYGYDKRIETYMFGIYWVCVFGNRGYCKIRLQGFGLLHIDRILCLDPELGIIYTVTSIKQCLNFFRDSFMFETEKDM